MIWFLIQQFTILSSLISETPSALALPSPQVKAYQALTITPRAPKERNVYLVQDLQRSLITKLQDLDQPAIRSGWALVNKELIDVNNHRGLVLNALHEDAVYRIGPTFEGNLNTCHNFVGKITTRLDLADKIPEQARYMWGEFDAASLGFEKSVPAPIRRTLIEEQVEGQDNKRLGLVETPAQFCGGSTSACGGGDIPEGKPLVNELALLPGSDKIPPEALTDSRIDLSQNQAVSEALEDPKTRTSLIRVGGSLSTFTTFSKAALGTLGIAGTAVGAVFVILDFVDHHWVGGAIGAVGLAVGVAISIAIPGPIGWVVGGIIMALFAILPRLLKKQNPPASLNGVQGIIQWKLFGDKSHTGNEQCQKGTKDTPGNKDCQALYGPGSLSMAMGMSNFDAIVFLQHFNDGFPMTTKDVAKNFYVVNPNKKGDGDDKPAVIRCHNNPGKLVGKAQEVIGQDDPKLCNNPTFELNRKLITLPNINATADKIFDRIIPAPNGDCKLIAYPGEQIFPKYGLKINGLPSAIACGLTAAINTDGIAVPIDGDTTKNAELGSDASHATDNQGGAYVDPPPKTPFKTLDPKNFACIVHKTDPPFCLPPGRYRKQHGMGLEISGIDGTTLPSRDWSFSTHWRDVNLNAHDKKARYFDRTYKDNQYFDKESQELKNFKIDMRQLNANYKDEAYFVVNGPGDGPEPVCCLFSGTKFDGNVWCAGVGGGDLPPQWKNKAQSVSCHAGANAWLYIESYGGIGGALVQGNIEDLSDQPYGNKKGTFSRRVKAMWVLKPE